jgi:mono/diheme cytochrome c family protein
MQNREASIRAVKYGQDGEIVVNGQSYNSVMMDPGLTDEEVADVLNYVLNSWGNTSGEQITPEAVAAIPSGK